MKKGLCILLAALLLCSFAAADITCKDNRLGCEVLQAVMQGSFDGFEAGDALQVRIFSAALSQVKAVTDEDRAHYCAHFQADPAAVQAQYDQALKSCLWADILLSPETGDPMETYARKVLLLFLSDASTIADAQRREAIRTRADDAVVALIAGEIGVTEAFVRSMMGLDVQ